MKTLNMVIPLNIGESKGFGRIVYGVHFVHVQETLVNFLRKVCLFSKKILLNIWLLEALFECGANTGPPGN